MVTNVTGFGSVNIRSKNNKLIPLGATTFSLTSDLTSEDILGRPLFDCGKEQALDTVTINEIYTLTLGVQKLDRTTFDIFSFGAKRDDHASISVPVPTPVTLSGGTITNADLAADQTVSFTILSDDEPGNIYLTQIESTGTVDPTTFLVTTGSIEFDPAHNGKSAVYQYETELTNQLGIGGNLPIDKYKSFEVYGVLCGAIAGKNKIWIPKANNINGISTDTTVDEYQKVLRPVIDTQRGMKAEFFLWS